MPQLDKLIPRIESGAASMIILEAGSPIRFATPGGPLAASTQILTSHQVLQLVSELATPDERGQMMLGRPFKFFYEFNGKNWLVEQEPGRTPLLVRLRQWVDRPSTGTSVPPTPGVLRRRDNDPPFGPFASVEEAREAMEKLMRLQVSRGAADLHIRVGEVPMFRLGGDLLRLEGEQPFTSQLVDAMLRSIMPEKNKAEFDVHFDTDFAYEIEGLSRFRVNVLRDRKGTAAVLRTIASNTVTVEEMAISPEVQALCNLTKGLVLVTGPTGSGKSTTLCALVDLINRTRSDHIITIEDPIEFVHQSKKCLITQRQVGLHTDSFKTALRAALREDPDIVLVGELRDLETIAIALETAETGHLVFGTLHTSTAASTINRIVDQFPADRQEQIRVMLAESLKGVVSQTLCKKIGGGRVAAREVLIVNKAVSALIRENKTVQINNVIQTQRKLGMETLNDALMTLVKTKQVEPEEAYLKSVERKDMLAKLRAAGFTVESTGGDE